MKTKVKLSIFLFFGLASLIYVFPFVFVEAAKLESGVTIKEAAPPTNETASPTNEICNNGIDDNGNGATDEVTCLPPPAGTCELLIVSGVPINYGQVKPGQDSAEQKITIKNVGTSAKSAVIIIKGGNWISDAAGNPTISGPEYTHFTRDVGLYYDMKNILSSKGAFLGSIAGGQSLTAYFQFRPMPNVYSGSFHQEVTLESIC